MNARPARKTGRFVVGLYDAHGRRTGTRRMTIAESAAVLGMPIAEAPSPEPEAPWHIVHVVGRSDGHARDWLTRMGVEHYYPMVRELRPIHRKRLSRRQRAATGLSVLQAKLVPMFPRYIFVRLTAAGNWHRVADVAGIGGLVAATGEASSPVPVGIDAALVDRLRTQEVDGAVEGDTPVRLVFAIGDPVAVIDGPFSGFNGVVENALDLPLDKVDAETRIRVAVSVFGRPTPVELDLWQVERLAGG